MGFFFKPLENNCSSSLQFVNGLPPIKPRLVLQDPKLYVDVLLSVHRQYRTLVDAAFGSEALCIAAVDKACRAVVNDNAVTRVRVFELLVVVASVATWG